MYPAEILWIRATTFRTPPARLLPFRARLRRRPLALCLTAAVALTACAARPPVSPVARCQPGQGKPVALFHLFFGRSIPLRGDVTDPDWDSFVTETMSPNMPMGYTILDGTGAWLNPTTGHTVRERTKIVLVALPDTAASTEAVSRVRVAYAARFHQMAVGVTAAPACGAFQ